MKNPSPRALAIIILVSLGISRLAAAADLDHGEMIYGECGGCHALRENRIGPRHCWVVGRPAGKTPDFNYSDAMKNSGLTWDEKTLDQFLTMPISFLPGTNMGYAGLFDKKDRADVIAYLEKISDDPEACDGVDKLH